MTILQDILAAVGWQTRVTENFRSVAPAGLYGINPATTTGLTLGYYGGQFNGATVADGTVALTASATNHVVAHRTTGAVTASTGTTNWFDTATYLQLYQLVASTGSFTIASTSDKRQAIGGSGTGGGPGTVTSVGLTMPGIFSVSGSPVTTSGTLAVSATDPASDQLVFWDDSASALAYLTLGTNLSVTGTTINASGGGGSVAGSDKQIQYNDGGVFGAEAGFEYDKTTNTLTVVKVNESKASDIASAATTDIGAATGNFVHITGTVTITAFGTVAAGARRLVIFDGALTLTHNATSLILPTGANITTAAGDTAACVSEGAGNWRVTSFQKKDGTSLAGGGGGLTYFTESLSTGSPNATVNVAALTVTGGTTNADQAIVPKGTGAILGQVPDSGTGGGNKRGAGAVDFQLSRTVNTQVASGAASAIPAGERNTASGGRSLAMGFNNVSSGQDSVALGDSNTASNAGAFAAGTSNVSSGTNAAAFGNTSTSSGLSSFAHGQLCTASGDYTEAGGYRSTTRGIYGARVYASGVNGVTGDAQRCEYVLRVRTTSATPARASTNGAAAASTNQVVLPTGGVFKFRAQVTACNETNTKNASWEIVGLAMNASGTLTIVGTPTVTLDFSTGTGSTWVVAVSADNTLKAVDFTVTGEASQNINWVANVFGVLTVAG